MKQLKNFIQAESAPGLILILTGLLAMILSNSPYAPEYFALINIRQPFDFIFVVNDVLMAVFFLDVGLEIKHQFLNGKLSKIRQILLPVIAACGGVIVPALIFALFNRSNPAALHGWAIPTATDIAFAVGVIILLGKRLPIQLKVLLLAIAVIDDLIAIVFIAVIYSQNISILYLSFAAVAVLLLCLLNYNNISNIVAYMAVGFVLWFCMLHSGVHPTISGVIIALTIPLSIGNKLHNNLYVLVSFVIMPLFAFTNAGVSLHNIRYFDLVDPVPLGIAAGLIFGKQFGIFSATWLAVKTRLALLPAGLTWKHIYGMAIIAGIGFTMSIFIGNLAYKTSGQEYILVSKLGVLTGSTISAIWGYLYLRRVIYLKN